MSERYLELKSELVTNKKDYKKWSKWSCVHILSHRVIRLGQDPDEVFKFIQENCLKVQPVVEEEPALPPPSPEPVAEPVAEPLAE